MSRGVRRRLVAGPCVNLTFAFFPRRLRHHGQNSLFSSPPVSRGADWTRSIEETSPRLKVPIYLGLVFWQPINKSSISLDSIPGGVEWFSDGWRSEDLETLSIGDARPAMSDDTDLGR